MNALATYRGLLANRPLTRLLGGEFVSAIGDWLYIVALLVVIYRESGDPLVLGLFGAARVVPYIVLSIPAGVAADRFDRRLILLVTDLARGAAMLAMAWVVATDGPVWMLVVLSIVASSFSTFFYPAIGAYVPNLTENERQLGPANSAWASLDNLGFVIGPVLGGLLVATGGVTFAFVINAATFLVIAAVLWRLPPSSNLNDPKDAAVIASSRPDTEPSAASPEPQERGPGLPPLAPLAGIAMTRFLDGLIFGGVGILTVILATDILRAGEAATGYLNAAIGVGGVAGALISGLLVLRRSLAMPLLGGAAAVAIGSLVLGFAEVLVVAIVAIVFVSAGHLILDVIATTLLQRVTTDAVRGRAVGAMMTIETVAEALGSLLLPVLVTGIGGIVVLGGAAALMVAAAVVSLVLLRPVLTRPETPFDAVVRRVAHLPLFVGASPASLERLLARLEPTPVTAGQTVIRQGDAADRFFIVASGSFDVEQLAADGTPQHLRRLGPDAVFGELGLLTGASRSATVTAREDGVLLALAAPDFLELAGSASVVRRRMLELYAPVVEGR